MVRIGQMRERLTLQQESGVDDGGGGYMLAWTDIVTVWAQVTPVVAKEAIQQDTVSATTTYLIYIRYRPEVREGLRIIWRGQELNIRSVLNEDGVRRILTIQATAGGAT